ncbi:hypothetical protein Tco_0171143 [Tanacetum coccineum]
MDLPWSMFAPNMDDDDDAVDKANEIELKLKDELELKDETAVAEIFVDLDEAYKEDVDSHLDEALVVEEVGDLRMFDNSVDDD